MPTFDASLTSGPMLLAICMLAAFVATTVLVMALTTPYVTPAKRLARYARHTGRRGSPGAEAEMLTLRERIIAPLAAEIRRTLQEMWLGRPTADAIRDLGDRTGAVGLKRLTDDIVQSDRMGISIAESLRNLARDARVMRRQAAEELARKAPIKMVPVLIFCVLPALGIVTTAPAAILLMRTFSQSAQLP